MICPKCGSRNLCVYDSLPDTDKYVFRRRKCKDCGEKFRTAEIIINDENSLKYGFSEADYGKFTRTHYKKGEEKHEGL